MSTSIRDRKYSPQDGLPHQIHLQRASQRASYDHRDEPGTTRDSSSQEHRAGVSLNRIKFERLRKTTEPDAQRWRLGAGKRGVLMLSQ